MPLSRYKHYIPVDVLTEAKRRLHHIFDIFDNVVVSFSGGKDSLAVLMLTKEVAEERGEGSFRVMFLDEELIHPSVVEFVETFRGLDWCDLEWWTVPLDSHAYLLGERLPCIQWDPDRGPDRWARPMPEWGLTEEDLGLPKGTVLKQRLLNEFAARGLKGKVAVLTGIRADESIQRYRSCMSKLNDNYIVSALDENEKPSKWVQTARPIFDWQEMDVFRFFYDRGITYAPIYDAQMWAGLKMRVSSALPVETSKSMDKMRSADPDLYDMISRVFPHVDVQSRYCRDLDKTGMIEKYAGSWEAMFAYVDEKMKSPVERAKARAELRRTQSRARSQPHLYPLTWVFRQLLSHGGAKPIGPRQLNQQNATERAISEEYLKDD
jgi:predicted phosphoadenosine phosphosulfate sulfurtransferase